MVQQWAGTMVVRTAELSEQMLVDMTVAKLAVMRVAMTVEMTVDSMDEPKVEPKAGMLVVTTAAKRADLLAVQMVGK